MEHQQTVMYAHTNGPSTQVQSTLSVELSMPVCLSHVGLDTASSVIIPVYTHTHTLIITLHHTCYDEIKGTQDFKTCSSHADSLHDSLLLVCLSVCCSLSSNLAASGLLDTSEYENSMTGWSGFVFEYQAVFCAGAPTRSNTALTLPPLLGLTTIFEPRGTITDQSGPERYSA